MEHILCDCEWTTAYIYRNTPTDKNETNALSQFVLQSNAIWAILHGLRKFVSYLLTYYLLTHIIRRTYIKRKFQTSDNLSGVCACVICMTVYLYTKLKYGNQIYLSIL